MDGAKNGVSYPGRYGVPTRLTMPPLQALRLYETGPEFDE
jgi:hypothetical protein